ncbi:hypothetical protein EVAR_2916_1 [Eumeta japonica]|uniref:Uncharacterized protein n=1 Tax=Eumeta variegata TaxID=151549 RepID=A0A4C1T0V9_EUMVA|nr:hypothetical protein EVAR_2916_1 [Eumeta japonica]
MNSILSNLGFDSPENRSSPPPADTCGPKVIINALLASWMGRIHVLERERANRRQWLTSALTRSLDDKQQRKLLLCVCTLPFVTRALDVELRFVTRIPNGDCTNCALTVTTKQA